jgi:hypothetical protein
VAVTYHWTQTFPAGGVVRVRHEYTPAYGHEQARMAEVANVHKDGCFDRNSLQGFRRRMAKGGDYVGLTWVKYILTTANTWQTPIEDFEVVIERPEGKKVSFCWVGKVVVAPGQADHRFRRMSITHSMASRSPIPRHADR